MAFKMKGFSGFGNSPIKNKTATGGDPKLEKLKAKRVANTKAGKIIKFGEGSNIIADKGPIDPWSSSSKATKASKASNFSKAVKNVGKIAKNVGKRFLGPIGAAITAADVVTTVPEIVKETKKSLKEDAKKELKRGRVKTHGPKY